MHLYSLHLLSRFHEHKLSVFFKGKNEKARKGEAYLIKSGRTIINIAINKLILKKKYLTGIENSTVFTKQHYHYLLFS